MEENKSTYYKADSFVEYELDIDPDVLVKAIEEYLWTHADFDFDECEVHSQNPFGVSLTAKCRKYVNGDPDDPDRDEDIEADCETDEPYQEADGLDAW